MTSTLSSSTLPLDKKETVLAYRKKLDDDYHLNDAKDAESEELTDDKKKTDIIVALLQNKIAAELSETLGKVPTTTELDEYVKKSIKFINEEKEMDDSVDDIDYKEQLVTKDLVEEEDDVLEEEDEESELEEEEELEELDQTDSDHDDEKGDAVIEYEYLDDDALECIKKQAEIDQELIVNNIIDTFEEINGYAPELEELRDIFKRIELSFEEEYEDELRDDFVESQGLSDTQAEFVEAVLEYPLDDVAVLSLAKRVLYENEEDKAYDDFLLDYDRVPGKKEFKKYLNKKLMKTLETDEDDDDDDEDYNVEDDEVTESSGDDEEWDENDETLTLDEKDNNEEDITKQEKEQLAEIEKEMETEEFKKEYTNAIENIKNLAKINQKKIIARMINNYGNDDATKNEISKTFHKLSKSVNTIPTAEKSKIYASPVVETKAGSRIDYYIGSPSRLNFNKIAEETLENINGQELNNDEHKLLNSFLAKPHNLKPLDDDEDDADYNPETDNDSVYQQDEIDEHEDTDEEEEEEANE